MVKYTKDRVINLDDTQSEESESSSSDGEDKCSQEMQKAIGYSIGKKVGLNHKVKKGLLKMYKENL